MKNVVVIIGIILVLFGTIFTFLPHDLHNSISGSLPHSHAQEKENEPHQHAGHDAHQFIGLIGILTGLLIAGTGWKLL